MQLFMLNKIHVKFTSCRQRVTTEYPSLMQHENQLVVSPECASICCSISLRLCSTWPRPFSSTSNFTTSMPYT